jgi:hypothetical protein
MVGFDNSGFDGCLHQPCCPAALESTTAHTGQRCDWTLDRRSVLLEPDHRRRVVEGNLAERADDVIRIQSERDAGDLAVCKERPRKFVLWRKVLRDRNRVVPCRAPGSMRLLAPTGISSSCCVLRFRYPTRKLRLPSGLVYQPSNAGVILAPNCLRGSGSC